MPPRPGPGANPDYTRVTALPAGRFRFIALDVETANGFGGSICQIGLACVRPDNHILSYATYVNPLQAFAPFNTQLHGIDAQTVRDAPDFTRIWRQMLPLLRIHHLVQHSNFDKSAINAACKAAGLPRPDLSWSDSVRIARDTWPEFRGNGGHGLAHLKQALGLEFEHHDAGEDARAAAQVVLHAERHSKQPFAALTRQMRRGQMKLDLQGPDD